MSNKRWLINLSYRGYTSYLLLPGHLYNITRCPFLKVLSSTSFRMPKVSKPGQRYVKAVYDGARWASKVLTAGKKAYTVSNRVRRAVKPYLKQPTKTNTTMVRRAKRKLRHAEFSAGHYRGSFKRGKRLRLDPYTQYGFVTTTEITGSVTDADCVYIGHSAMAGAHMLDNILCTLLRTLFQSVGHQVITDRYQTIVSQSAAATLGSIGYMLRLEKRNMTSDALTAFEYSLAANDSIGSIIGDAATGSVGLWATLRNTFIDYLSGLDANALGITVPTRLMLFMRDSDGAGVVNRFIGELRIDQMQLHVRVKSELKIQNRTAAASASNDAEDVTNNPIQGLKYSFNSGSPLWAANGPNVLGRMPDFTGVITQRVSSFFIGADSGTYREPPNPKMWRNCVASAKVRLEPGAIKSDFIKYEVSMPLLKFLDRMGWRRGANTLENGITQPQTVKIVGKSTLLALEDVINVSAATVINCAYEVNRVTGCYITFKKNPPSVGAFFGLTQSNLAP